VFEYHLRGRYQIADTSSWTSFKVLEGLPTTCKQFKNKWICVSSVILRLLVHVLLIHMIRNHEHEVNFTLICNTMWISYNSAVARSIKLGSQQC
jgi:hypothetical protein